MPAPGLPFPSKTRRTPRRPLESNGPSLGVTGLNKLQLLTFFLRCRSLLKNKKPMNDQVKSVVGMIIRHAVNGAGSGLVANGYINESDLSTASGFAMVVVAAAWSWWEKRSRNK